MKLLAAMITLFATAALSAPATSPNEVQDIKVLLQDIASCSGICFCDRGRCRCTSCIENTCDTYDNGPC